jgi:hypothetical protein
MKILIILLLIILLVLAAILVAVRSNLCIIDNKKYIKKGGGMVSINAIGSFIDESDLPPLSSEEINSFAAYLALFFKDDGDFLSVKHSTERNDAYEQWQNCNKKMKKGEYNEYYLSMDLGDITKELYKLVKILNEINSQPKGPRNDTIKQSIVENIVELFNAKRKKELDDEKLAQSFSYDANVNHMQQELEDEELARRKQAVENEKLEQALKDEEFAKEFDKKLNGEYRSPRNVSRSHRPHSQIEAQEYQIERPSRFKAKTLATNIQELEDAKIAKKLEKELNSENTEQILKSTYGVQEHPINQYSAFKDEMLGMDSRYTQPRDSKKYSLSDYVSSNSASSRGYDSNHLKSTASLRDYDSSHLKSPASSLRDYDSSPRSYGSSHLKSSASSSSGYASSLRGYASSSRGYASSSNRFTPVVQKLGNKNISSEDIEKKIAELDKKITEFKKQIKYYEKSYNSSPHNSTLNLIKSCRDHIINLESQILKIERAKQYNSQTSDI